ncbi:MAG: sulfatase [Verrucomicrobiae bacterium]|nr:sulfatase [Verrucomicrobiae bacterium]
MLAPPTTPAHAPFVFRWTCIGVAAFWLVHFLASGLTLALSSGDFTNAHGTEAREHYMGFIVLANLKLLKAYAIAIIGYSVLTFPVVWGWMRWRVIPGRRKSVLWRTQLVAGAIILHSAASLALTRPYFYNTEITSWARPIVDSIPALIRNSWVTAAPVIFVAAIGLFYTHMILGLVGRKWRQQPRLRTSMAAFTGILAMLAVATGAFSRTAVSVPARTQPNILILASDSLRADHLSCNGYDRNTTPAIDALTAKSVNFKKCFTPVGSTLESMTSIMTSQYPHTHGLQHMYPDKAQIDTLNSNAPTIANQLEEAGYETEVLGDWCAGIFHVVPLGFDAISVSDYDNFKIYISQAVSVHHWVLPLYFDNPIGYSLFPELEAFAQFVTPETVTDRVIERLENRATAEKPFFYTVFYSSTHLPYHTGEPYCDLFTDPGYDGPNQYKMHFDVDGFIAGRNMDETWQQMRDKEIAQIKGLYDGCIRQFDDNVGRILESLDATGQLDNTIILVTSDHGDDQLEPNTSFGHGLSFNGGDQGNHIPFILHAPGMTSGTQVDGIVRTIDFAPTLLDLVGAPKHPDMEGTSLVASIKNPKKDHSLAFYGETAFLFVNRKIPGEEPLNLPPMDRVTFVDPEFDYHFVLKEKYQQAVLETKERALRTQRYKLVRTPGVHAPILRLYDLSNDRHCETDISRANPHILAPMKAALLRWMDDKKESRISEIFPDGEPEPVAP